MEKEILGLWTSKYAGPFQYPVSKAIKGYYEKIKNPISLQDIRNNNGEKFLPMKKWLYVIAMSSYSMKMKFLGSETDAFIIFLLDTDFFLAFTADYKYSTAQMLIDDVQLIAHNARSFNGEGNELAISAGKLVSQLQTALNHERKHFGIQGDVINVLEEAIKKKYVP